jgi:hypothetical protein
MIKDERPLKRQKVLESHHTSSIEVAFQDVWTYKAAVEETQSGDNESPRTEYSKYQRSQDEEFGAENDEEVCFGMASLPSGYEQLR